MAPRFPTIVDALRSHAASHPSALAYAFREDRSGHEKGSLTYAQLYARARAHAERLTAHARPGDRALLLFPPGLEFIVAFFSCMVAGVIAVPMVFPSRKRLRDSSVSIVGDCAPTLGLTSGDQLDMVREVFAAVVPPGLTWLAIDTDAVPNEGEHPAPPPPAPTDLALLQYTSGSTSAPKGVMVSHGNLAANVEMIRAADLLDRESTRVGWIPLHHDMGLVFNAMQATYVGALCVLMSPVAFMMRPLSWLRAVQEYQADFVIAPNFAFDRCVEAYRPDRVEGLDLSCLRLALNGAEPVRASTIAKFAETFEPHGLRPSAPHPTYGMAEATLMISGGLHGGRPRLWEVARDAFQAKHARSPAKGEATQVLVGCGKNLVDQRIAIVDPETFRRLPPGRVGEIWVHGPNVAQGYWQRPEATRETFQARIEGEGDVAWLRTGDLGCMDETGELYVTGRIKDVIIIRGGNYYPQDIEHTAETSHPDLHAGFGAAFTVPQGHQQQLVIVYEVRRDRMRSIDTDAVEDAVRQAVVLEHDLTVYDVVIVRPGGVPRTTSGKVRRRTTRDLWSEGKLQALGHYRHAPPSEPPGPSASPPSSIRRMTEDDLEAALQIVNKAIAQGDSTHGPGPLSRDELRSRVMAPQARFESYVVPGDDGALVGWAALAPHTGRAIYDTIGELDVFVLPRHRRKGIGKALTLHALQRAEALGYRGLLAIVQPTPPFVLSGLMRLGFRAVASLSDVLPVGTQWRDIIVLSKRFTADPEVGDAP